MKPNNNTFVHIRGITIIESPLTSHKGTFLQRISCFLEEFHGKITQSVSVYELDISCFNAESER